jgi:uncharacterized DUF497 family protein
MLRFTWDPAKGQRNLLKHDVSFAEACTVFEDPFAVYLDDPRHSEYEGRSLVIGFSNRQRLLVVAYVEPVPNLTRIISARRAGMCERRNYEDL